MTNAITENLVAHQREVERIRANPDLSQPAKQRMINEVTARRAEKSRRLQEAERERIEKAVQSAEAAVLSISYPERASASEKAMIAISYRDAFSRAERVASDPDNPDALSDLLDRAEKQGDCQLADAIYHIAVLRGRSGVIEAYQASRPAAKRNWEHFVEARREAESVGNLLHRGLEQAFASRELSS